MKRVTQKLSLAGIALLSTTLFSPAVFAASNPYGIKYTGGEPLGSLTVLDRTTMEETVLFDNVIVKPDLVDGLEPIMRMDESIDFEDNGSTKIKHGYMGTEATGCNAVEYVTLSTKELSGASSTTDENHYKSGDVVKFYIKQDENLLEVNLNDVVLENVEDKTLAVAFSKEHSRLFVGYPVYSDCDKTETYVEDRLAAVDDSRVFVDLIIRQIDNMSNKRTIIKNGLYFGLTDIDVAQSYKIINKNNQLSKGNMFTKTAEELQGSPLGSGMLNMFVEDGSYIYAQNYKENVKNGKNIYGQTYFEERAACDGDERKAECFGTLDILESENLHSDIYTPISRQTQEEGFNIVLGFASRASSGIEFYFSNKAEISYITDGNGSISGEKEEEVDIEGNPTGSTSKPKDGYEFSYWIADKDVELEDGTKIKAGQPISAAQIKQVIVYENLTFTAVHEAVASDEDVPAVPDTGMNTEDKSASLVTVSLISVSIIALVIRVLPFFTRKKIGFNK